VKSIWLGCTNINLNEVMYNINVPLCSQVLRSNMASWEVPKSSCLLSKNLKSRILVVFLFSVSETVDRLNEVDKGVPTAWVEMLMLNWFQFTKWRSGWCPANAITLIIWEHQQQRKKQTWEMKKKTEFLSNQTFREVIEGLGEDSLYGV